jgi:hypothetical protein
MKEPENLTLRLIREIREDVRKIDTVDAKVDRLRSDFLSEIRGIRKYIASETILGRYAAVDVDRRLD